MTDNRKEAEDRALYLLENVNPHQLAVELVSIEDRLQAVIDACARMQDQRDELADQLKDATAQCGVMAELLRDLREGAEIHLHNCTICKNAEGIANWMSKLERIDATLAGRLPSRQLPIISPDWMKAPAWARFWAVDFDGLANWFSHEPEAAMGRWCYQQKRNRQHLVAGSCEIDVKKMKELGLRDWWKDTLAAAPKADHPEHSLEMVRVRKTGGSFQNTGTVLAEFRTLAGEPRIALESDAPVAGMLHIYRPDQVEKLGMNTAAPKSAGKGEE